MSSKIARINFCLVSLFTITLSLWKSSEVNHATYLNMENYIGGSTILHFTFSVLIGYFAVFTFPQFANSTKSDAFGIRLLICLLLVSAAPAVAPRPVTTLMTPSGRPTSFANWAK